MRTATAMSLLLVATSFLALVAAQRPTESGIRLTNSSALAATKKDLSAAYKAVVPAVVAAERSRAAVCKPATKCKILDASKFWGSKTYVEVKPYTTLALLKGAKKAYTSAVAILGKLSAFSMTSSVLTLRGSKVESTDKDTWFTLLNSSIGFAASQILGTFRSFSLTGRSSLGVDKCQVDLVNTVVSVNPGSKLVIRDTGFNVNGTSSTSYPFVVAGSTVEITRGVLLFKNVKAAFFFNSTVSLLDVQLVLINSRVTFLGGALNSTNSVARLNNSTLTFSNIRFTGDRYLSAITGFKGATKPLPKPYLDATGRELALAGTGNVTLRSANK